MLGRDYSQENYSAKASSECAQVLHCSATLFSSVMANTIVSVGHTDFSRFSWEFVDKRKLLLQADSSQPVGASLCDWRKSSLGSQPSSSRAGGSSPARTPAASLRPPPLSASKLKSGTAQKNGCTTTDMPSSRNKLSTSGGMEYGSHVVVSAY